MKIKLRIFMNILIGAVLHLKSIVMTTRNKKLVFNQIIFLVILSLISFSSYAQWQKSTFEPWGSPNYQLFEVAYPADNIAYIAGFRFVYKSTDGGVTWDRILDKGGFAAFNNLIFTNADTGFVNLYGAIYRTFDGGENWSTITGNHSQPIKLTGEILYASYISNDTAYIIKSKDYGTSWSVIYHQYEENAEPYLFDFIDSLQAYFINPNHLDQVLKTTDGLASLDTLFIPNELIPQKRYDFIDSEHGYLYGSWGTESHPTRTRNEGIYYFPIDLDGFGVLPVLDLDYNTDLLYATSLYGKIFYSEKFGRYWKEQQLPTLEPIYSIAFLNNKKGIAISSSTVFYTTNGGTTAVNEIDNLQHLISVYPNPSEDVILLHIDPTVIIKSIDIISTKGQLIKSCNSIFNKLNVKKFPAGTYFIRFGLEHGIVTKKIIIK